MWSEFNKYVGLKFPRQKRKDYKQPLWVDCGKDIIPIKMSG